MNRRLLFKFLFGGAASVAAAKLGPTGIAPTQPEVGRLGLCSQVLSDDEQDLIAKQLTYACNPVIYVEEDGSTPDLPDFANIRPGGLYASRGRFHMLQYPGQAPLTGVVKP